MSPRTRKFFYNFEAKALPFTVTILLIIAGLSVFFVLMPESTVKATTLPLDFSVEYTGVTHLSDSYRDSFIYKNDTGDYWLFYIEKDDEELRYKRGSSFPDAFDGASGNVDTDAYRISGVTTISNVLHVYFISRPGNLEYATWDGSSWSSTDTSIDFDSDNLGFAEYDDGTSQYWVVAEEYDTNDITVVNSSDGETWGNSVEIDTDGKKPCPVVYDSELYCFYYDYDGDEVVYNKFDGSSWGSQQAVSGWIDTFEYNTPRACYHEGEDCIFLAVQNQSDSNDCIYKIYNGSGWSDEQDFDGSDSNEIGLVSYFNNTLVVPYYDTGNSDIYYRVSNFSAPSEDASEFGIIDSYLDSGLLKWSGQAGDTTYSNETVGAGNNVTFYVDVNVSENCTDVYIDLSADTTFQVGGSGATGVNFSTGGNATMYLQVSNDTDWDSSDWGEFNSTNGYNISLNTSTDGNTWDDICNDVNVFPIRKASGNITITCRFKLVLDAGISAGTYNITNTAWKILHKYETTW